ncbi:MAG: extracellular solute-binding protein [Mycobacterium sp.]|nr:extracellular solute-binding protein [Mycobacterium sp.]
MERDRTFSRRKILANAALVGAAVSIPGLAGCGGGSGKSGPQPTYGKVSGALAAEAKRAGNKSLSLLSQAQYLTTTDKAIADAYQAFAQQTGTKIKNATINGDAGNLVAKQDAAVKAHNVQDMAFVSAGRFVAQLHDLGDIVDVSDVVESMSRQFGPPTGVAADELKIDGKWWGIPFYTIGAGIFVRNDWMSAKGVKPADLKTWSDARDAALEISDPSKNQFGWGVTINRGGDANGFIEGVINTYGGAINADDGRKVMFDSPETVEAVTFIAEIFTKDKYKKMMPPGILSWTDTGNNEAWLAGTIGLTLNQASLYAQSKDTKNPVYDKTAVLPGFAGPATKTNLTTADLSAFVIFKNAKNPDLAKAVAQYMSSGTTFLALVKRSGAGLVLPAWTKVWTENPYYLNGDPIFKATHATVTKKLPLSTTTGLHFPQASSSGRNAVLQAYILTDMMGQIVQKGQSVKDAVKTANSRIVQTFEQLGIKQ